jgi:hypothetical protein
MRLDPLRTGCAVGAVFGLSHLAWAALVAFGGATRLLHFVLWLHFVSLPIGLAPFELGRAVVLVVFTAVVGGVLGVVFALVWNGLHRTEPAEPPAAEFIGVTIVETSHEGMGGA